MTFDLERSERLHERVRAAIASGAPASPPAFASLAADVFAHQLASVEPFARLCAARGVDPAGLAQIDRVPAIPSEAFRLARIAAHPPELDVRVFRTSGTTGGASLRGAHPLRTLGTYEAAALAWADAMLCPAGWPPLALVLAPSADRAPASSLSFMIDLFVSRRGMSAHHLTTDRGVDAEAAARAAGEARRGSTPVLVLGTAFAFVHLLDEASGRDLVLPEGSRLMVTGGFKGRTREVGEPELRRELEKLLGLRAGAVVGEYGMTELSSQLYEAPGARGVYRAPPWLAVSAADPDTLAPLPRGREGLARFVDLANVDSAAAVQTLDWIRVEPDGDVRLLGRAPGAPPRGCSLAMEELFERGG